MFSEVLLVIGCTKTGIMCYIVCDMVAILIKTKDVEQISNDNDFLGR